MLGEENPFRDMNAFNAGGKDIYERHLIIFDTSDSSSTDGGIRLEASMCYLRGKVYAHLNNYDRAKQCYQEALTIDAKCYEALDALITNCLMNAEEGQSWFLCQSEIH